jgi:serine/threonine-protein kinase
VHTRGASSSPRVEPPVSPGEIVADKYRIEQTIGSGGMGVVVAATHLQLNQRVALKFVRSQSQSDRVLSERFLREARASFRLRSEHAVRVLDVGTLPTGVPFMVMELLEGQDLKDVLLARGPLPEADAIEYMLQACVALQEAHAYGIVHRDLKPRNLYLTRRVDGTPCVKVLDFGISKVPKEDGPDSGGPLTSPEIALGSPRYMAPEQWKASSAVDARADVYALGMILYELLTGELPLRDLPLGELLRRMVAGAIPGPREVRPSISDGMNKVVLKALRPHAEERFQSAQQLADALRTVRATAEPMRSKLPSSNPLSSTAATAVVPRPQLQLAASQAVPTPQDRPPPSALEPSTRREVPGKLGDASERTLTPDEEPVFDEPATLVSSQPKPKPAPSRVAHSATLQSSTVPPEVEAALARAQAAKPKVEEVRFDDATTVDPPRILHQTLPLAAAAPISGSGVSPIAQSVQGQPASVPQPQLQTVPMAAPPGAALGPPPISQSQPLMPPQVIQAGITTLPTSRKRGMPTWAWVLIVLVLGFALGGGLALAFALKAV